MTRSNTIGVIGGTELPPVKRSFEAFAAGAAAANPRIKVLTSYIGNWDDVSAGKEQALAQIARGADIIFQNADAAGLGVFQAARESHGVRMIGSNSDQTSLAPSLTIASVVIDLPHAFLSVAREIQSKQFTPHVIMLGVAEDVVKLIVNPIFVDSIPDRTRASVDSIQQRMRSGNFRPPA